MKLNADRIVSLSAMVVGVSSVIIILYQTHLTRQAQHASMFPYLMISLDSNEGGTHLTLTNAGVGPALVDDVRIRYQGKESVSDPYDFYVTLHPDQAPRLSVNKVTPGRLIPAGTSIQMLGNSDPAERQAMLGSMLDLFSVAEVPRIWYAGSEARERAVVEITYTSVYGDRWRLRSDRFVPDRL